MKFLEFIHWSRLNIVLLVFFLNLYVCKKLSILSYRTISMAFLLSLLIFLFYIYNKHTDLLEDFYNKEFRIIKDYFSLKLIYIYIFCVFLLLLILYPEIYMIVFWGIFSNFAYFLFKKNRYIPLLKNFIASFNYFLIIIIAPLLISRIDFNFFDLFFSNIDLFIGIFIFAMILDIRDYEGDKMANVNSLVVKLGEKKSLLIISCLLVFLPLFSHFFLNRDIGIYYILNVLFMLGFTLLAFLKQNRNYYYYLIDIEAVYALGLLIYG